MAITFIDKRTGRVIGRVLGKSLSGLDLRGVNLAGQNLSGINFSFADLRDADLRGANLTGCSFFQANLDGARLAGHLHDDSTLTSCWTPTPRPVWRVRRKKAARVLIPMCPSR